MGIQLVSSRWFTSGFRTQKNRPPILLGLMAGLGNLSKVLHRQCAPTAHRLTVPPSGELAVIVIIAIQALAHDADESILTTSRVVKTRLRITTKAQRQKTVCLLILCVLVPLW